MCNIKHRHCQSAKVVVGPIADPFTTIIAMGVIARKNADQVRVPGQAAQRLLKNHMAVPPAIELPAQPHLSAEGIVINLIEEWNIAVSGCGSSCSRTSCKTASAGHIEIRRTVDTDAVDRQVVCEDSLGTIPMMM